MSPDSGTSARQHQAPSRIAGRAVAAGAALVVLGLAALFAAEEPARVPEGLVRIFAASGALDAPDRATVVFCTNFGTAAAPAAVVFFQSDGTAACTLSGTIPVGVTGVLATRATAALSETGTCLSPPEITQGSVQAFADQSAAGVICSAQVVDATNAAPAFVLALRTEAR
ncbi:MAG: hypothetical protein KBF21_13375 [Thermoanaerobaculia bacterium]|nr:hypothetical protein [Thermoanaerobaculia bacterium]MBP9825208.1 hypothetical protein [Thermoanaerobaculia bacterium]